MIDYAEILKKYPNGVLATQDGGKVKTRYFQYLFCDGKKVYFCTANDKPVFQQLKANPYVSFCVTSPDFNPVMSVNGKAVFVNDLALKNRALDENPAIKGIYQSGDNPVFEMFYIDTEEIETFDFAQGPQTYQL